MHSGTMDALGLLFARAGATVVTGAPEGSDALVLADIARLAHGREGPRAVLHLARDDRRLKTLAEALRFFAPDVEIVSFPAWDCLPYDRVSPRAEIVARRMATLVRLNDGRFDRPTLVVTTVNAAIQRIAPPDTIAGACLSVVPGSLLAMGRIRSFLSENGFTQTGTVLEPGDYAVRGGIIDIFPSGFTQPVRLDLFGDTVESIRGFDPHSQRTTARLERLDLHPASEAPLNDKTIARFRTSYTAAFGARAGRNELYEAISAGRRYQGMEHWLALFHDRLATLFDCAEWAAVGFDHLADEALRERQALIADYYDARRQALDHDRFGAPPYNPLPPDRLYMSETEWEERLSALAVARFTPFMAPQSASRRVISLKNRQGRNFAPERAREGCHVFESLKHHIETLKTQGKRVVVACWSDGSRERFAGILRDRGIMEVAQARSWSDVISLERQVVSVITVGLEAGFETPELAVVAEQDILGDRLIRQTRKKRKSGNFIAEASNLAAGDLVVHVDHGIGRFEGLRTIAVHDAPHDCLLIVYADKARLFVPVENIELLSRHGSDRAGVQLDRLGGAGWQARKARLKGRIRDMAERLIRTAAARSLRQSDVMTPPDGLYQEFCAEFPYEETEDQRDAIKAVIDDLGSGHPMDRLVCGDVGFGKTEVALRAAFVTVMSGKQVCVVVPTTLLARQHYATFSERFRGLPVRIEHMSRLVARKRIDATKKGLARGDVDIVIGTHALLGSKNPFRDLGLLVIDEEQHFGVKHKEKLKELRANVHVLTLTATPIPRTLQLALTGVRDLSLITTAPVDRLAVRSFIAPFDPVTIREALLREHYRAGQSFYVCPRISDLGPVHEFLTDQAPEVKVVVAHGRMPPGELEDIMSAFYDRKFDVLLSTTIVESGLDIPTVNTLIVHRADRFGLAQLYQLRGRIGRSKQRAYALFTLPTRGGLTEGAERRLKVLQSLDTLGAGFTLASHDLDIRGAGNLLGDEQSGHIREVGYELYQQMLEEAVAGLRTGDGREVGTGPWSPRINIGNAVLIPEHYVDDLSLRLGLYRRLADMESDQDIQGFAAELHDRFGTLPKEVEQLLEVVSLKLVCRAANVALVDAGPKGVVIGFRDDHFANPSGLVDYIARQGAFAKLRPDHKLILKQGWTTPRDHVKTIRREVEALARIASQGVNAVCTSRSGAPLANV